MEQISRAFEEEKEHLVQEVKKLQQELFNQSKSLSQQRKREPRESVSNGKQRRKDLSLETLERKTCNCPC